MACSGENIKSYCGISAYEEEITSLSDSTDSVAWADISISDSEHVISFSMLSDEMAVETFTGQVFALHGNGYYDDRLILGSFSPVENHNIALFKILNENIPELTLLVEDMFTGELKEYRFEISQEKFSALMNVAKKNNGFARKRIGGF